MNYPQEHIKPYGTEGEKSRQVEQMFNNIAPAYDRLNHILSFGMDRYWRWRAISCLKREAPASILDVATGTGDFALLAYRKLKPASLIGIDISEGMLEVGQKKVIEKGWGKNIFLKKEDCTALSFDGNTFEAITVAFGIRNFEDLNKGLSEMYRVLDKGGKLVILEFATPDKFPMNILFKIYSTVFMPFIGRILSKDAHAYSYLPETIAVFPKGNAMKAILLNTGFKRTNVYALTGGICMLYVATK
ncbi:MAG: bifunctional demethylmenaquinone methyltransferase/2-methoxy-6-polyprenyl-1,4-benzoquinol methylase UbiE [Bacteroides sp.]|nr:bifunctional demethylmenaquinone methyltransferase/2-methoxy-6-polyprenyl-1,4-benzoquinol methylase UbiE [Bacteroides sp.]